MCLIFGSIASLWRVLRTPFFKWWVLFFLIIHPKYGPWLRFVVIEINTSFKPVAPEIPSDLCEKCEACLKACPIEGLLKPYKLTDKKSCVAYIELDKPTPEPLPRCNKCLIFCPVSSVPSLFISHK